MVCDCRRTASPVPVFLMMLIFVTISAAAQQADTQPRNQSTESQQGQTPQSPAGTVEGQTAVHPAENQAEHPTQPQAEHPTEKVEQAAERPAGAKLTPADLKDSPQKAWKILKEGIADHNSEKRAAAIRALGLLPNSREAVSVAEKALDDDKPEVRGAAAFALGEMHSKRSIPKLRVAMGDEDISVVMVAANSLRSLRDPQAYRVYYAVLTGERKSGKGMLADQQKMLRDPKKLAMFGFEEGIGFIPFAGMGYSAMKELRKDDTSPVRAAAAKALAKDPDPRSAKALKDATWDKSWIVRVAALDAIAHRGDPSLLATAYESMEDDKDAVRFTAAAAVVRLTMVSAGRPKQASLKR